MFPIIYAGIMLNVFSHLLCSKLCWHNRLVPSIDPCAVAVNGTTLGATTYTALVVSRSSFHSVAIVCLGYYDFQKVPYYRFN